MGVGGGRVARCVVLAQVVRVCRRGFGRGVEVVVWPGVLYWVVMSVIVVCVLYARGAPSVRVPWARSDRRAPCVA